MHRLLIVGMLLLWPALALAQPLSCEEQLSQTQKHLQLAIGERDTAKQTTVNVWTALEKAQAELAKLKDTQAKATTAQPVPAQEEHKD
jgi:hypothetical protein